MGQFCEENVTIKKGEICDICRLGPSRALEVPMHVLVIVTGTVKMTATVAVLVAVSVCCNFGVSVFCMFF